MWAWRWGVRVTARLERLERDPWPRWETRRQAWPLAPAADWSGAYHSEAALADDADRYAEKSSRRSSAREATAPAGPSRAVMFA